MSTNRSPSSCRILIVDDDHVFLTPGEGLLTEHRSPRGLCSGCAAGHRPGHPRPARSGLARYSASWRRRPHGPETLKEQRAYAEYSGDYHQCLRPGTVPTPVAKLGAAAYLSKPITRTDLLATIEQVQNLQEG